jgi:hypothetical protein
MHPGLSAEALSSIAFLGVFLSGFQPKFNPSSWLFVLPVKVSVLLLVTNRAC